MKTEKKLILMFSVLLGFILLSIVGYLYFNNIKREEIKQSELANKQYATQLAVKQANEYLRKFTEDYTIWDEMVKFVANPDTLWAKDNINTLIKTSKVKYVWIYDDNAQKIYSIVSEDAMEIADPIPAAQLKEALCKHFEDSTFSCHFYSRYHDKVIEISGARIFPSDDYSRKGEHVGYFFIAKYLDESAIEQLEILTDSKVTLSYGDASDDSKDKFATVITEPIQNWDKQTIAHLTFTSEDKIGKTEDKFTKISLVFFVGFLAMIFLVGFLFIRANVTVPLRKITDSLDSNNIEPIAELMKQKDEFGQIARLINLSVEQTDKLQTLNATKDKFFSIIAHDLKNPFGVILATTEFLSDSSFEMSKQEIEEFTKDLNDSAKLVFNLLENLLTWARSQKGSISFNPEAARLKTISEIQMYMLKPQAEKKGITLKMDIDEDIAFFGDQNMISTVIRNLLSNSIKFTKECGTVTLRARYTDDGFVTMCVEDTGVGMSQETIDKLFRIDVNVTTMGTSQERGTGLGLILCQEFLEKNNGKIRVESTEGVGSKFIFTIPTPPRN